MASASAALLEPGYRLDRYELLCKIGQGGMASVWLARAQGKHGFERLVAIKTVLPEHAADPDFRTALLDEARIAAAIDHPNVARILDVGEERDIPFLVLEYVAGDSLIRLHRKLEESGQRIPPSIVLRVLADTCAGLHAAHELTGPDGSPLGIVHRDISPQNILVNDLGIAKLIDFGVAKAAGRLAGETATGIMKGKVAYMAPEQALGVPVDRRADVWAMGAVAFFLLAGAIPFDAPNDAARVIRSVTGEPPDPLPRSVPAAIAEVILRSLSRSASARYASAADVRDALEAAAKKTSMTATTEDVARYFAQYLPDSMRARKTTLDRAREAADERSRQRAVLAYAPSSPPGSATGPHLPVAPISAPQMPLLADETSAGTIGRAVALRSVEAPRSRKHVTVAAASGVALLVIVALGVGALAGRSMTRTGPRQSGGAGAEGGAPVASVPPVTIDASSALDAPDEPSAPVIASVATTPDEPSVAPSTSASARARAPKRPHVTRPAPGTAVTRPTTVKPLPTKPTDETIF